MTEPVPRLTDSQRAVILSLASGYAIRIAPDSDLTIMDTGLVEPYLETERGLFTGLRLTKAGVAVAEKLKGAV